MDPGALEQLTSKFRTNPRLTAMALLVLFILFLAGAWLTGFFQEKGRSAADRNAALQAEPSLRIQYFRFQGTPLLDLVSRGYGFSPDVGFRYKPHWLKNPVYEELVSMLALSGQPRNATGLPFDIINVHVEHPALSAPREFEFRDQGFGEENEPPEAPDLRKQLAGAMTIFRGPSLVDAFKPEFLLEKLQNDEYWTLVLEDRSESGNPPLATFFAAPSAYEVLRYRHHAEVALRDPISQRLLRRYPAQRDLVFLKVRDDHGAYYGTLIIREIRLIVLDVENAGNHPVSLRSLRAKMLEAADAFTLTELQDAAAVQARARTSDLPIPLELLLPGEHLFIPLRIEFGLGDKQRWNPEVVLTKEILPAASETYAEVTAPVTFSLLTGVDADEKAITATYVVPEMVLRRKTDFGRLAEREYVLGSALEPVALVIRRAGGRSQEYPIRKFDPNAIVVSGAFEKGSCPIAYAADASGAWRRLGPVLTNAVTKSLETTESRDVPIARAYRIAEEEQETSYIASVDLRVEYRNKESQVLAPRESRRHWPRPGGYLVLRRGQAVELTFDIPDAVDVVHAKLLVRGFYVPDVLLNSPASRARSGRRVAKQASDAVHQ